MRAGSLMCCMMAGFWLFPAFSTRAYTEDCDVGRSDRLVLLDWSAEPGRMGPNTRFKLKSNRPKLVRSIQANLVFEDAQGNLLADMPLSPDMRIAAGAERIEQDAILDPQMNETLKPENVEARICTRYVEYADGGFEEF